MNILHKVTFAFVALLGAFTAATASAAQLDLRDSDVVLGPKDAKVRIVEFASMTCGHCAHFNKDVFPKIKKEYVDTGKVSFVFRHMPWGNLALAVAKITECAGPENREKFITAFFNTQHNWSRAADPLAAITQIARLGGMPSEKVDSCLLDAELHERLVSEKEKDMQSLAIESTPTVFINDERIVGTRDFDFYKNIIEQKLAE